MLQGLHLDPLCHRCIKVGRNQCTSCPYDELIEDAGLEEAPKNKFRGMKI